MAGGETKQRINDLEYENAILRETVARLSVKPTPRDRFAMAAMTGIITRQATYFTAEDFHKYSEWSYNIADAMMEARDGK